MQAAKTPGSIWEWFQFSKGDARVGSRSAFFKSLSQLSDDSFIALVQAAIEPLQGSLRPLASLREDGRKQVPALNLLIEQLRNPLNQREKQLQFLLWHRGYLLNRHQRIIAREVPCSLGGIRRATVADFLAIDDIRRVPLIVEVKCGEATDSLTGVLFEVLGQWCFHKSVKSAFQLQLLNDGVELESSVIQPEAAVVAPVSFYRETLRRSNSPKRLGEAAHAFRLLRILKDTFGLSVIFIVVSKHWAYQGTGLICRPLPRPGTWDR